MLKTAKTIPLIGRGLVPAAAVTTALLSPPSLGAPGDLDPAFGDVGRLGPFLDGPAWSLEPQSDGTVLLGGGSAGYFYWGSWYGAPSFVRTISASGSADPVLGAFDFGSSQIFDAVRQPDGKIVAVGRQIVTDYTDTRLAVFRLRPDGSRDIPFGTGGSGTFRLSTEEHGYHHDATSVALDPDGRIVVAGSRDAKLIVLRLLSDGSLDQSFASAGIFEGPGNEDQSGGQSGARTNLLRTGTGGYRVMTTTKAGCRVVGLTADGAIDPAFGNTGTATAAGAATSCNSMAAQPDGRLLVAGSGNGRAFATRLLGDGQPDATFDAGVVAAAMRSATAIAADGNTGAVVAGVGDDGVSIMRLSAGGGLDAAFGVAGAATFDLDTEWAASPVVNDLFVGSDRKITGAGGVCVPEDCWWWDQAFVVRLLGDGGDSPGVLGIREQFDVVTNESEGEIVLNVRRTGGRSGSVGVDWQTANVEWEGATPGADFTASSGSLTWTDGDTSVRQIRVPILPDNVVEDREVFQVVLSGQQDGAGLGRRLATIAIAPDGAPHGQFNLPDEYVDTQEHQPAHVYVTRDYYQSGAVSVTLTPVSGTAIAGEDFGSSPVTVTWSDGEVGWKEAVIPIINDSLAEDMETFTIELSNPTGGALIGSRSSTTVRIQRNDTNNPGSTGGNSGGGVFGWLSLLMLGMLRLSRRTIPGRRDGGKSARGHMGDKFVMDS